MERGRRVVVWLLLMLPLLAVVAPTGTAFAAPKPDDDDDPKKETEEQRQQRQRTNRGNKDDVYTERNAMAVHQDESQPYVEIATRDGLQRVNLLCGDQCPQIPVGDYLEADGEKQHELLFDATDTATALSDALKWW